MWGRVTEVGVLLLLLSLQAPLDAVRASLSSSSTLGCTIVQQQLDDRGTSLSRAIPWRQSSQRQDDAPRRRSERASGSRETEREREGESSLDALSLLYSLLTSSLFSLTHSPAGNSFYRVTAPSSHSLSLFLSGFWVCVLCVVCLCERERERECECLNACV